MEKKDKEELAETEEPAEAGESTQQTEEGGEPPMRGRSFDIEVESTAKRRSLIIGLTWPALAENILASLVSIVDNIMVAGLGSYAINAVGLVVQPRFIMMAAFMALGVGSTALVARFRGARDPKSANAVLNQSMLITLAFTAVLCVVMLLFGESILRFLSTGSLSEKTLEEAWAYFKIQIYGFPTLSLTFAINASLRGAGNTRASFYSNTAANLVNVFFNYCMIGGNLGFPAWGVTGASVATVIGQTVALGMAAYFVARGKNFVFFDFKTLFHIDWSMIKRILNIGLPALVEQVIMRAGMLLFVMIVTSLGDAAYTAHMVAMNIQQLSFTTGMAFGTAATTLVGQCLGRNRPDLAKIYVRMTQRMGLVVSVLVALLLFFGGRPIVGLYTNEAGIIALSVLMLQIIAVANPISNARFIYISALRGAGDSRFAAVITFVGVLLVRPLISAALVFYPLQIGLAGVWIALVSDGIICYILSLMRYRKGDWQNIRV
ncbi:MAG: MATE family efflux transporter [Christensenellaceae bacterium]|jgi:putative MATE family efflux protein|nr:MATE family efflux transporter [Christensenellaceae bacterium]